MQRPADCISKTTDGFVKHNPVQKTLPSCGARSCFRNRADGLQLAAHFSLSRVLLMGRQMEAAVRHLRVAKSDDSASPYLPTQDALQAFGGHAVCCEVLIPAC